MMRSPYNRCRVLLIAMGLLPMALTGCSPANNQAALASEQPPERADLTRQFSIVEWSREGGKQDPLSIALQIAASAGGDWIAILPRPTDNVKWQPQTVVNGRRGIVSMPPGADSPEDRLLAASLKAIRNSGTKLVWE